MNWNYSVLYSSEDKNFAGNITDDIINPKNTKIKSEVLCKKKLSKVKSYNVEMNRRNLIEAIKENNVEKVENLLNDFNKYGGLINDKDKYGRNLFYWSICSNNIKISKVIIKYADKYKTKLDINNKGPNNWYPFLIAVSNERIDMVTLIIDYANKWDTMLKINDKMVHNWYPLLIATRDNNIEIVQKILDYAEEHGINLDINSKSEEGYSPFQYSVNCNNTELSKLIIDYADKNRIILEINEKDKVGNSPLFSLIRNNNIEMVKYLLNYVIKNNIDLNTIINTKNNRGDTPLLLAASENNTDMVKLIIQYANEKNIKLNVNEKNEDRLTALIKGVNYNNYELVKSIIDYSYKHNIKLKINKTPFYYAVYNNNREMVELIMDYSNKSGIILNINCKNKKGYYPLLLAVDNNNIEIVKLIIDYSNDHHIPLTYNDTYVKKNKQIYNLILDYKQRNEDLLKITSRTPKMNGMGNTEKEFKKVRKENIVRRQTTQSLDFNDDTYKLINAVKKYDYQKTNNILCEFNSNKIGLINLVDENGWTAFHWACYLGYENFVDLLLEYEVDDSMKTKKGLGDDHKYKNKTARQIAKLRHHKKCVRNIWIYRIKKVFIDALGIGQRASQLYQFIPT